MTNCSLYLLAVYRYPIFFGIRSGGVFIGRGIVEIFSVMRQIAERKDERSGHRIVGGVTEGVLSSYLPRVGKELFGTVVVILRKFLHIKGQDLFVHNNRTILICCQCTGAVCSLPVPPGGIGVGRMHEHHAEQQNRNNYCQRTLFHTPRLPCFQFDINPTLLPDVRNSTDKNRQPIGVIYNGIDERVIKSYSVNVL